MDGVVKVHVNDALFLMPPPHITRYLEKRFPRPKVDPEWLLGCHEWLMSQPGANDSSHKFLIDVELQLLQSDLSDSMVDGTGLPENISQSDHPQANARLAGPPILVEIAAMTEIGHSAYQLDQIRVVREDRMRLGQTDEDGEDEGDLEIEGEGPMPKYPRGMLKFELFDGAATLTAIEYKSLPEIVLGKTPLGFKMLLKNPLIRHGIAFLEPDTVELLGHKTNDREKLQAGDFARGLRTRMGLPDHDQPEISPQSQIPQPVVVPPVRSPLREISPSNPSLNSTYNDDANLEPRRRKLPSTDATIAPTQASSTSTSSATLVASHCSTTTSHYFSNSEPPSSAANTGLYGLKFDLTTAQSSQAPVQDEIDEEEEAMLNYFDSAVILEAPDPSVPNENVPPTVIQSLNPIPTPSQSRILTPSSFPTRSLTQSRKITPIARASTPGDSSIEIVPSSASEKTRKQTPATHSPVSRSSIEIVSFASSSSFQAPTRSRPRTHWRTKGKEKASSGDGGFSSGSSVEQSENIDPEHIFLEGFGRSTSSDIYVAASASPEKRRKRPIKPLPKRCKSLQSSSQGSPQPQFREVIEINSDSSNSPSPRTALLSEVMKGSDDDIEVLSIEESEGFSNEEQYDKENMPVMMRHVRRKINTRHIVLNDTSFGNVKKEGGCSDDVIDLSD